MRNAALRKFLAKNGDDAKKILNEKDGKGKIKEKKYGGDGDDMEPDDDEDDLMKPKKKLVVSDDPKWKGKLGKHDDCWK
jgi:hypothetical protein